MKQDTYLIKINEIYIGNAIGQKAIQIIFITKYINNKE